MRTEPRRGRARRAYGLRDSDARGASGRRGRKRGGDRPTSGSSWGAWCRLRIDCDLRSRQRPSRSPAVARSLLQVGRGGLWAMNLAGKRIVVTGGSGFLGSHVVDELRTYSPAELVVPRQRDYDLVRSGAAARLLRDARP